MGPENPLKKRWAETNNVHHEGHPGNGINYDHEEKQNSIANIKTLRFGRFQAQYTKNSGKKVDPMRNLNPASGIANRGWICKFQIRTKEE